MTDKKFLEYVQEFKKELLESTLYGFIGLKDYEIKRTVFLQCRYKELVPKYIISCRSIDELRTFMNGVSYTSEARKAYILDSFNPLLERLEEKVYSTTLPGLNSLKKEFNSKYISAQIDAMQEQQDKNPTDAIGKAKELIESCCITILEGKKIKHNKKDDLGKLTKKTFECLNLVTVDVDEGDQLQKTLNQIIGSLRSLALGINELRNPYGSGHGKSANYVGLTKEYSRLAVGSTAVLVSFLWNCYKNS